ncbi:enoyl-CoA hydratase-related protein [Rhodoplanes sp. Z2-YC6860]|uniref:enoyl-CoA hydratase-related protein n=1 Tax=Rhodoplanes sp. Z2-YC6860 TaxID=674703 RepID=UPI00082DE8F5|nr:enoyl-CoA hydratase-related protein [Rhodoplanes sp. Z2-YC6860]
MDENPILVERRDGYRVVTLNRPQRLNAFTVPMHQALAAAIAEAENDKSCRALLFTGSGRAFCSGQDLNERVLPSGEVVVPGEGLKKYFNPLILKIRALPFPVVCAVNGIAAGAGLNVALACDVVLAARSATFTQVFARIGLVPDAGGTWLLPRLVGQARARGLALLAEPLTAEKAEQWGLIWKAIDDATLMIEAEKLCAEFARGPTVAYDLIKRALDAAEGNDLAAQLDLEARLQREAGSTQDYKGAVHAFLDKRKPAFTGER